MKKLEIIQVGSTIKIIILFLIVYGVSACSKQEAKTIIDQETSKIIYQKKSSAVENDLVCNDNLILAEQIGNQTLLGVETISILKSNKLTKDLKVNISNIKRLTYDKTDTKVIIIPFKNNIEKSLVIYNLKSKSKFKFAIASYSRKGQLSHFELNDLNGEPLYSLDVDSDNRIGNISFGEGNLNYGRFSETQFEESDISFKYGDGDSCPETTSSFKECMLCGLKECADDWVCVAVFAVAPEATLIGFSLGCALF